MYGTCVCVCVIHVEVKKQPVGVGSRFPLWVLGIKLRTAGLAFSAFTCSAIFLILIFVFSI